MKKVAVLLMAIAFTSYGFSQSLDSTSTSPLIGDSYTYYYADTSVAPGAAGQGITWDFSELTGSGESTTVSIVNPSNTPDASFFPNSMMADTTTKTDIPHNYYSSSADVLKSQGFVLTNTPLVGGKSILNFDVDEEQMLTFPFTYNDTIADTISGHMHIMTLGIDTTLTGTGSVKADGSGTLKLPHGVTIPNVLRVTTTGNLTATATIGTINVTIERHFFYAPDSSKYPVLKFSSITLSSPLGGGTFNLAFCQYPLNEDTTTAIHDIPEITSFQIFPNPTQNQVTLSLNLQKPQDIAIYIYDLTGRTLKTINKRRLNGTQNISINTENFSSGLYHIVLKDGHHFISRKLIIE